MENTFAAWAKKFEDVKAEGRETLTINEIRDFVVMMISEAHPFIHQILFNDESVKNHVAFGFAVDEKPEFGFDVCFRRKDGHYPSDRPLYDAYLEVELEDARKRLEAADTRRRELEAVIGRKSMEALKSPETQAMWDLVDENDKLVAKLNLADAVCAAADRLVLAHAGKPSTGQECIDLQDALDARRTLGGRSGDETMIDSSDTSQSLDLPPDVQADIARVRTLLSYANLNEMRLMAILDVLVTDWKRKIQGAFP